MTAFNCRVVSAKESIFVGQVQMLIANGIEGELGILAGHTPLVTLLKPGTLEFRLPDGTEEVIYVRGGVLEVQPKMVTILADVTERAPDLDEATIMAARHEAAQLLAQQNANVDTAAALATLAETFAQLQTIRKYKNRVGG